MATSPQVVNERFSYNEAGQLIGEYGATGRDYIWLGNLPVAAVDGGASVTLNYVHADVLGTPRVVSDAAGNIIWQWNFQGNPFGEQEPTGSYQYNPRFPGQYHDAETDLQYNVNRDYEAATGRYIESDAIGLRGGLGTYSYVAGRPLVRFDSLGYQVESADASEDERDEWNGPFLPPLEQNPYRSPAEVEYQQEQFGGDCMAPGTNRLLLYRSVLQDELDDINAKGEFDNPYGTENKYFSTSAEGAAQYARMSKNAFGWGPYTTVETSVDPATLDSMNMIGVDSGIPTVVIPTSMLPGLTPPVIWSYSAIPRK